MLKFETARQHFRNNLKDVIVQHHFRGSILSYEVATLSQTGVLINTVLLCYLNRFQVSQKKV